MSALAVVMLKCDACEESAQVVLRETRPKSRRRVMFDVWTVAVW